VTPTIGFVPYELIHKNEKIKLYDLGGDATFRESWRHYFDDSYGFIYVVDSSEQTRLDENHVELKQLLQEEKVQNKPILM
jgi:GTPase SAR1 family protein